MHSSRITIQVSERYFAERIHHNKKKTKQNPGAARQKVCREMRFITILSRNDAINGQAASGLIVSVEESRGPGRGPSNY